MAAEIAEFDATHVVLVDTTPAAITHEIQIRALDALQATMTLGHQCSPDVLIYMVRQLYHVQVLAWLVTISGVDFGHGVGFSEEVGELLARSECVAVKMLGEKVIPQK